jgi:Tol biopolymer transport system component
MRTACSRAKAALPILLLAAGTAAAQDGRMTALMPRLETYPALSPDQRFVVYASDLTGKLNLYRLELASRQVHRLTAGDAEDSAASWSPDGTRIVFQREGPAGDRDLWEIDADGRNPRNLTNTPGVSEQHPRYAADGTRVIFDSNRAETRQGVPYKAQNYEIYSLSLRSGAVARHTNSDGWDMYGSTSPDGKRLAWRRALPGGQPDEQNFDIFVKDLRTGAEKNLTDHPAQDTNPHWSPADSWIVFTSTRHGSSDIFVMRPDGTEVRRLTSGAGRSLAYARPSFSADGRKIIANRIVARVTDIVLLDFSPERAAAELPVRPASASEPTAPPELDEAAATRFAQLALSCVQKEYPNKISHVLLSDADARPPRALTPAFYGCYDWHSAVHGHWLLARLSRLFPNAAFAKEARAALAANLTPKNIAVEAAYVKGAQRASFERPYGLAWLLQLAAELRGWDDSQGRQWATALEPLEQVAAGKLKSWLPKLHYPIRVGEHDQTAFAFGLIWDWARVAGDTEMSALLTDAAARFYRRDRACPLHYEPSGQDFLSPCLAEADFMRRALEPAAFATWLAEFLPQIPRKGGADWLPPGVVTDRSDPKLAHIDGLNLSRAWMLEGIAHALGSRDKRTPALLAAAAAHRAAALPAVTGEHYEGGHWLGTFAVYLTTR